MVGRRIEVDPGQSCGEAKHLRKVVRDVEPVDGGDQREDVAAEVAASHLGRRTFLRSAVLGGAVLAGGGLLEACSSSTSPSASPGGKASAPKKGGNLRVGLTGGGSSWVTRTYDPELDLVYWGIGNPAPWNARARKGDNLFTNSVFAIRPKTGERVWYSWNPSPSRSP